jgi:hypothetical protein
MDTGALFAGVKWQGHEAESLYPSSAEVTNTRLIKHRENFQIEVFLVVTLCHHLHPDSMDIRNVVILPQHYTASQSRSLTSDTSSS